MLALITDASRGIGLGIARALLRQGDTCVLTARKISDQVTALQQEYPQRVHFVQADMADESTPQTVRAYCEQTFGQVPDLLVNNAGIAPVERTDMLTLKRENFEKLIHINLEGTFFMLQAIAQGMQRRGSGRIINISSVSSYTASTERAEYCIAKAGISMMTKLFAARMAECGVGVFEISPGIIMTDMTACVQDKYRKMIDDGITPIRRFGMPQDIADCVLAVASGKLDFCTGTVLHADGGFQIRRL